MSTLLYRATVRLSRVVGNVSRALPRSGAPLLVVFALRVGQRHYRFVSDPPITLSAPDRCDRQTVLEQAAADYLQRLHAMAKGLSPSNAELWEVSSQS